MKLIFVKTAYEEEFQNALEENDRKNINDLIKRGKAVITK